MPSLKSCIINELFLQSLYFCFTNNKGDKKRTHALFQKQYNKAESGFLKTFYPKQVLNKTNHIKFSKIKIYSLYCVSHYPYNSK